jgi:xylulokinase
MTRLLGIDVGTSGVKAGIFDPTGHLLGLGRAPYTVDAPHPNWAQCDPERWWRGVLKALAGACEAAGIAPAAIDSVGIGVLYPCVMPLAADGHALYPAILYSDQRSLSQVAAIEALIPRETYENRIGNVLVPGTCAVTSILWLRDTYPEIYAETEAFGWANTFITARLTGEIYVDPTTVALSGLVDIEDPWQWSETLCDTLGVDPQRLPKIAGAADVVGTVTREAAEVTGLRVGTPVVCGAGDVPTSTVGAGVKAAVSDKVPSTSGNRGRWNAPEMSADVSADASAVAYAAGSTDCVAAPLPRPTEDRRWVNSTYIPRGVWLGIGATTSSGVSVAWAARELLACEELGTMTELAASAPPGSHRLLYLPYLQGERTPIWDPLARGMVMGLTASTTRADLARAIFEGTAFALRQVIECLETVVGHPVAQIRAMGGGTRNPLWNQIKADVLQKALLVLEFQETGALGAALLAGLGIGVYETFEEATDVAQRVSGGVTVTPDPAHAAIYDELFELYTQAYPETKALAHALAGQKADFSGA